MNIYHVRLSYENFATHFNTCQTPHVTQVLSITIMFTASSQTNMRANINLVNNLSNT